MSEERKKDRREDFSVQNAVLQISLCSFVLFFFFFLTRFDTQMQFVQLVSVSLSLSVSLSVSLFRSVSLHKHSPATLFIVHPDNLDINKNCPVQTRVIQDKVQSPLTAEGRRSRSDSLVPLVIGSVQVALLAIGEKYLLAFATADF